MLFVGFADNTKGFRCINPENKKITIARDVSFLENTSDSMITIDNDDSDSVRDVSTNESISSKITKEERSQDNTFHSISDQESENQEEEDRGGRNTRTGGNCTKIIKNS